MNKWRWAAMTMLGLAATPAWAAMKSQPLEWQHDGTTFSGVLVYDDDGDARRPGVVMVPNWLGVSADAVEKGECDFGILICGSGQGVAITANKH